MQGFTSGLERHLASVGSIQVIVGERIYTRALLSDGRKFLHNRPLRQWREIFPDVFKSLDRSTIVNLREIQLVKDHGDGSGHQDKITLGDVAVKALRELL